MQTKQLVLGGGAVLGALAILWGLSKIAAPDSETLPAIDPALGTPDQATIPEGGGMADYWSYNQPQFQAAPYSQPLPYAGAPTGASSAVDFSEYLTGLGGGTFDYAAAQSVLFGNIQSLLNSHPAASAADLTKAWVDNLASSVPSAGSSPASSFGATPTPSNVPRESSPVPLVAPVTYAQPLPPSSQAAYSAALAGVYRQQAATGRV
jgi:hypothetical protein